MPQKNCITLVETIVGPFVPAWEVQVSRRISMHRLTSSGDGEEYFVAGEVGALRKRSVDHIAETDAGIALYPAAHHENIYRVVVLAADVGANL
jgi:hypothetical protein